MLSLNAAIEAARAGDRKKLQFIADGKKTSRLIKENFNEIKLNKCMKWNNRSYNKYRTAYEEVKHGSGGIQNARRKDKIYEKIETTVEVGKITGAIHEQSTAIDDKYGKVRYI